MTTCPSSLADAKKNNADCESLNVVVVGSLWSSSVAGETTARRQFRRRRVDNDLVWTSLIASTDSVDERRYGDSRRF